MKHRCKTCGKRFAATNANHLYCSHDCRPSTYQAAYPDDRRKCLTCGRPFTRTARAQRYCSAECRVSDTHEYRHRKYLERRTTPPGPRGGSQPDLERRAANVAAATALRRQGLTMKEIGERMGITRQRVHQLLTTGR